jgi:hypothetical protein
MKKRGFYFFRYSVSIGLLCWVLSRAELSRIVELAENLPVTAIIIAIIAFNLSQWFSALRLRYYYENAGARMSQRTALALSYANLFCHLFLPSAKVGNTYIIQFMKRSASSTSLPGMHLQCAKLGNGLLASLLLLFGMLSSLDIGIHKNWLVLLATLLSAVSVYGYRYLAGRFLKESAEASWDSFRYSLGVQIMALFAVTALLLSMHGQAGIVEYLILFLSATILGLLPITVGGLGIREAIFFYGAELINHSSAAPVMDAELGVTLSLLYFAVTALSSLPGVFCTRWLRQNLVHNWPNDGLVPSTLVQTEATS